MCNLYMDYPDWTPEQRVAVMLVEALRYSHPKNLSTPATDPVPLQVDSPLNPPVAGTYSEAMT